MSPRKYLPGEPGPLPMVGAIRNAVARGRVLGAEAMKEKIVAWLRADDGAKITPMSAHKTLLDAADAIERGDVK